MKIATAKARIANPVPVFLSDAESHISSFNYLVITAKKRISKATVIMMRRYISCRNLDFSWNSSCFLSQSSSLSSNFNSSVSIVPSETCKSLEMRCQSINRGRYQKKIATPIKKGKIQRLLSEREKMTRRASATTTRSRSRKYAQGTVGRKTAPQRGQLSLPGVSKGSVHRRVLQTGQGWDISRDENTTPSPKARP